MIIPFKKWLFLEEFGVVETEALCQKLSPEQKKPDMYRHQQLQSRVMQIFSLTALEANWLLNH